MDRAETNLVRGDVVATFHDRRDRKTEKRRRRPSASVCLAACPTSLLYFLCSLTEDKSANLGEQGVLKSKCVCPAVIESLGQDSYKFKQVKG